jgi:hypothetical protein
MCRAGRSPAAQSRPGGPSLVQRCVAREVLGAERFHVGRPVGQVDPLFRHRIKCRPEPRELVGLIGRRRPVRPRVEGETSTARFRYPGRSLLFLVTLWTGVILIIASSVYLQRLLGERGLLAMEQLMGMLLALIAINLFINGMPYQDADGFSDFETLELMSTQRVEVWKGANALRLGANTMGGAVNFVTDTQFEGIKGNLQAGRSVYGDAIGGNG